MSYRNLVDVGLNVDYSGLEETLARIDQNVEVLTSRVKDIEDGGYPVDEDKVHDLVASYVSDNDLVSSDELDRALNEHDFSNDLDDAIQNRDLVTEDNIDEHIASYHSTNSLMDDSDVDEKIRDAIENGDFVNPSQMDEAIDEKVSDALEALTRRVADLEANILAVQENSNTAMTFFDLIKQAFALLQR